MAKKPEQLETTEEVVVTEKPVKEAKVKEEKRVYLMNTQNYSIFVPYFKDECLVAPRARVQVLESGLPKQLPKGIYKL